MPKRTKKSRPPRSLESDPSECPSPVDAGAPSAWVAAAVLIVAVLVVYGRAMDAPFIFDDYNSVQTNETIVSLWPLVGDVAQPGPLRTPQYAPTSARPLANLSLALNYRFGGLNTTGYHLVNVFLHILSAMLLWAIVRRTLRLPYFNGRFDAVAGWLALIVALLWALHPLQTETVVYTTQRTELMMGLFYLATLYCSLRYWTVMPVPLGEGQGENVERHEGTSRNLDPNRAGWLLLATLACLAGVASKEVMASAPLVVLLFERTFIAGSLWKALRQSWPLYAGLACGWLLLLWLMYDNPHSDSAGFHLGVPAYVWWFTQAKVLLMYFKLVVWPWPLVIHYEMPYLDSLAESWMYLLPVGILGVTILVLLWRNHPVGFLGTWVFAILLPTLIVPIVTEVAAERRMYLPLAAIATLVVVGGYNLAQLVLRRHGDKRRAALRFPPALAAVSVPALVVAIVFSAISTRRLAAYENEMALWQDVLRLQPHNHVAHENVGTLYFREDRLPDAIDHYREAIRLKPDSSLAHYNLGQALLKTGQFDEATARFRDAVRYQPGSPKLLNNLGVALFIADQNEQAIVAFREAIELQPVMWRAHDNLGSALARAGRLPEAIEKFEAALEINPLAADVYGHLADAQAKSNQLEKAITTAERAMALARIHDQYATAAKIDAQLKTYRSSLAGAEIRSTNASAAKPPSN